MVDPSVYFVMDLSGDPLLRLPISSWQGTRRLTAASYVQCVVPAAAEHLDAVMARYAQGGARINLARRVLAPDGAVSELAVVSVPMDSPTYDRGPRRATLTLSGYEHQTYDDTTTQRLLTGVRSRSQTATTQRVRASIDWILRPGMIAQGDGWSFAIDWISYYVNRSDQYMDIGARAL